MRLQLVEQIRRHLDDADAGVGFRLGDAQTPAGKVDVTPAERHSIIVACWHMLTTGELYREAGADYFQHADPHRGTRRLVKQLEALGHHVTLEPMAA